ncbi:hypothetical protein LTR36_004897 [Oleoguttula mirabilis]|uniref:Uncharacterized protein n=1 Tax=Oleoguttula mirabilis TaxID=1507867 RepID=A0AAV9JGB8_9PEZI|nr:hypothetical protein LTR36_004897 [Oleoguttula mirabilis]
MVKDGISIFMVDATGKHQAVTHDLNLTKFRALSDLPVTGCHNPKLPRNSVILPQGTADAKAAARITTWIAKSDISAPKPLSPDVLELEHFDDCVNVLATSHALRIKRDARGDQLRDAIYAYIKQGPLSFNEFAMVVDYLHYDVGLVKTAKHAVMFSKAKGGARTPPEMGRIEAFAREWGFWGEMVGIEKEIFGGMEERERRDQADAAAAAARRGRRGGPGGPGFTVVR